MRPKAARRFRAPFALALTAALAFATSPPQAVETSKPEIVFLTVDIGPDGLSLREWNTVPGALKQARAPQIRSGIALRVVSADDKVLAESLIDDPRVVHLEYSDPGNPEALMGRTIVRNEATFTIRVPAHPGNSRLEFFTQSREMKNGRPELVKAPLGSIDWPATRQGRSK